MTVAGELSLFALDPDQTFAAAVADHLVEHVGDADGVVTVHVCRPRTRCSRSRCCCSAGGAAR